MQQGSPFGRGEGITDGPDGSGEGPLARTGGVEAVLVTDQGLSTAHLVREEWVVGGSLQAVCGRVFLPAALTAPLGVPCALCVAVTRVPDRRVASARRVLRALQAWAARSGP